jgi:site-specific DNA-cytosine methylase
MKLKVLIACEYSGRVREAFRALGHDAVSCDLLPSEDNSIHHFQSTVESILARNSNFDLMIAHPPCTHLAVSGARHFAEKIADGRQKAALYFVQMLFDAPIPMICIENPVSIISSRIRKPDQYIQPWMFGHGETKKTGLWLKNLPNLIPTEIVEGRQDIVHRMPPGPDRWKNRSRTYQGIANAMAAQWGNI